MSDSHYPDRDTDTDEDAPSAFEERLHSALRNPLPAEWREGIIDCACANDDEKISWWKGLPKALTWPVAACWIASLGLHLTVPEPAPYHDFSVTRAAADYGAGASTAARDTTNRKETGLMFAEWIERNRSLGIGVGLAASGFEIH